MYIYIFYQNRLSIKTENLQKGIAAKEWNDRYDTVRNSNHNYDLTVADKRTYVKSVDQNRIFKFVDRMSQPQIAD